MTWTRRKMLQTGAGGLLAGALTACGPVRPAAPGPARQEAGELTWLIADHGGAAGQAWFEQTLIPAFTRERPKVQVTTIYVSWGELGQKRDTLYAAGTGPDLLQSGAGNAHAYRGLVISLDDRLRRWKDWEDYYLALVRGIRPRLPAAPHDRHGSAPRPLFPLSRSRPQHQRFEAGRRRA